MSRSGSARASIGAITLLLVAACGSATAVRPTSAPSGAPSAAAVRATATTLATTSPTTAPRSPRPTPAASTGPQTYDTTKLGAAFDLPLTIELPDHWTPHAPPLMNPVGALGFIHTGEPASDRSQWWDFGFMLVDGASVLDPTEIADPKGHTKLPWPKSYIDYLVALPGVTTVEAPSDTTALGAPARRVIVSTPAMHPTIYLAGDTMWMGGGAIGIDPPFTRQVIETVLNGKKVLIEHDSIPSLFDEHNPIVDSVLATAALKP
jgi:hypothetical protein